MRRSSVQMNSIDESDWEFELEEKSKSELKQIEETEENHTARGE